MRILLVEDDPALSLGVRRALQREGWQVDHVGDGEQALTATRTSQFDAAVLDLGLPRRDGVSVLREWRAKQLDLPVLVLTARDGLSDRVAGLNAGADDYLIKPFEVSELVARLRAITRRRGGHASEEITVGDLNLSATKKTARVATHMLDLSPREFALLELLVCSAGQPVSKERITSTLSSWDADFSDNSAEVYIHRLRKKLHASQVRIRTRRGFGYQLDAGAAPTKPVESADE
jgi:DNA-binding response OmpR family regulator